MKFETLHIGEETNIKAYLETVPGHYVEVLHFADASYAIRFHLPIADGTQGLSLEVCDEIGELMDWIHGQVTADIR